MEERPPPRSLSDDLRNFFQNKSQSSRDIQSCDFCLQSRSVSSSSSSYGNNKTIVLVQLNDSFGEKIVRVLSQVLLVPLDLNNENPPPPNHHKEGQPDDERAASLSSLCVECTTALTTLTDLFSRLEELRVEFNDLRRKVGRQVILGSLRRSQSDWKSWEEKIEEIENVFPSCVQSNSKVRNGDRSVRTTIVPIVPVKVENVEERLQEDADADADWNNDFSSFCDIILEGEDVKLKNMTPVVRLERLSPEQIQQRVRFPAPTSSTDIAIGIKVEDPDTFFVDPLESPHPPVEFDQLSSSFDIFQNDALHSVHYSSNSPTLESCQEQSNKSNRNLRKRRRPSSSNEIGFISNVLENDNNNDDLDDYSIDLQETSSEDDDSDFETSHRRHSKPHRTSSTSAKKSSTKVKVKMEDSNDNETTRRLVCPKCPVDFSTMRALQKHLRNIHRLNPLQINSALSSQYPLTCPHCPESFGFKRLLKRHIRLTHKYPKNFQCPSCRESFRGPVLLNAHRKSVHWNIPNLPPSVFLQRRSSKEVAFKCSVCPKTFPTSRDLRRHEESVHSIIAEHYKVRCTHCDVTFSDPAKFKWHKLHTHSLVGELNGSLLQCQFCLKTFLYKRERREHQKHKHGYQQKSQEGQNEGQEGQNEGQEGQVKGQEDQSPQNITCYMCKIPFTSCEDLKEHESGEEHHKKLISAVSVHCNVCLENFSGNTAALEEHLESEAHKKVLESLGPFDELTFCVPCRENFPSKEELKKHKQRAEHDQVTCVYMLNTHHDNEEEYNDGGSGQFKCHVCPKVFDFQSRLHRHLLRVHPNDAEFRCTACELVFTRISDFYYHRRSHNKAELNVIDCQKCGKSFTDKRNLTRHTRLVHTGETSVCHQCGKVYPTSLALDTHIRKAHELIRPSCSYCSASFKMQLAVRRHIIRNHPAEFLESNGGLPYHPCIVCYYTFPSPEDLTEHMKAHMHLKCPSCPEERFFPNKQLLQEHQRVHTGEKPYECSICHKRVQTKSNLRKHMWIHKSHRPFKCSHCEASFWRNHSLETHMAQFNSTGACPVKGKGANYKPRGTRKKRKTKNQEDESSEGEYSDY